MRQLLCCVAAQGLKYLVKSPSTQQWFCVYSASENFRISKKDILDNQFRCVEQHFRHLLHWRQSPVVCYLFLKDLIAKELRRCQPFEESLLERQNSQSQSCQSHIAKGLGCIVLFFG